MLFVTEPLAHFGCFMVDQCRMLYSAEAMSLGYRFTLSIIQTQIGPKWAPEKGSALIEVVIASLCLGIAVVGVALMMSSARSFTVAQGDDRVAVYLAQDKLEQLLASGFAAIPFTGGACPTTCYQLQENLTAGEDNTQTFTRETTVDCVPKPDDTQDFTTPINCPNSPVFKRITVTVTPAMRQADAKTLQTVLVSPP